MSDTIIRILRYGGLALVLVFLVPLFAVGPLGPYMGSPPPNVTAPTTDAPLGFYWTMELIGVALVIVGFLARLDGRRS